MHTLAGAPSCTRRVAAGPRSPCRAAHAGPCRAVHVHPQRPWQRCLGKAALLGWRACGAASLAAWASQFPRAAGLPATRRARGTRQVLGPRASHTGTVWAPEGISLRSMRLFAESSKAPACIVVLTPHSSQVRGRHTRMSGGWLGFSSSPRRSEGSHAPYVWDLPAEGLSAPLASGPLPPAARGVA